MKKKLTLVCLAFLAIAAVAVNTAKRAAETTWVKASSISVGDVVLFTNVDAQKELKAIELFGSNSVGSTEDYTGNTPAGLYPLTIVAGSAEGSVAFKTSDDKYLAWTSGNTLIAADAVDANSSWNVTFEGEVPTIANVADAARKLQYNSGNPRFATYTSAQKPITIWKQGEAPADAVAKPTISGETPFAEQTTVTLACTTEGAEIFYTTNGSEPTAASTKYAEPFVLKATATVKAIAIKGDSQSEIASKDFICSTAPDLAALNVLPDETAFTFTGEVLVVAKPTAKHVYVRDAKGSSLIYDKSGEKTAAAEVGKTIAANWTGQVSIFNKLFEAVPDANLVMKDGDPVEVSYEAVDLGDVKAENVNKVVTLKGVEYTVDGKNIQITKGNAVVVGYNQFGLEIAAPEEGKTYNMTGAIGRYNDKIQFQPIAIEEVVPPVDIEISPESGADIAAVLTAAAEGKNVGNITINLAEGATYTTSTSIVAPGNVTINGNGATIDASALTTPFIQMATIAEGAELNEKDALVIDGITIKDVTVTGLPYQLIYGNKQKYLMKQLLVENCVIGVNGTAKKTVFDFNSGGNAAELIIDKSTLWANPSNEQNGGLFSSQSGHGSIQDLGSDKQLFAITNSTIYNIACGKTTNSQRRNSTAGMEFKVENSVIVNSGKSGQFVVGLNGGGANSAQTYTISNNIFNFDGADVSAAEEAKVQEKIADAAFNSIAGVIAFTSLETPDFGGVFKLGDGATAPTTPVGDPRWTINYEKDAPAKLYLITGNWDRTNMIDVPFNNETQAYEYETAPEGKMWFAFADKQLTAEEAEADPNWTDFNTNHRYAIGAGDVDASLNEALPLLKIEGTLVLEPVPAGKVYKISVAKDWSTVTITVEDPTGIQSISADKFAEGEWYTIQGVRVEKPAKGIFIHNGRKVVVK